MNRMVSVSTPCCTSLKSLSTVTSRSCVQQASEAQGKTAKDEWHSLAGLLTQVILAHVPSLADEGSRARVALLTRRLLRPETCKESG